MTIPFTDGREDTRMTPEQRIEAAARAMAVEHGVDPDAEGPGVTHAVEDRGDGVPAIMTDHRGPLWRMWVADATAALCAGYPELHSPPPRSWLAPWELTNELKSVGRRAILDDVFGTEPEAAWAAMRTAHLAQ